MTIIRTNYCTNPGFEVNITGLAPSNATLTRITSDKKYGTACAQIAVTGSAQGAFMAGPGYGAPCNPGDQFTFSAYVKGPAGQQYNLQWDWIAATGTTQILSVSPNATFAGTWERVSITGVAPATAVSCGLGIKSASAFTGNILLDGVQYERGPVMGSQFDGGTAQRGNIGYAWTGSANVSTSVEQYVLPTTLLSLLSDAPCPRIGVTVDGLLTGPTVYNLWRTADGKRRIVRGARNRNAVDSDYVIDYEAPLGRPVTYDVEVVSGTNAAVATYPSTATLNSSTWWIQDPLVPGSAQPLATNKSGGALSLTSAAVKNLEYGMGMNIIPILGSSEPVALVGARQLASNMDFSAFTRTAQATTNLRNLLQQAPILLVRTNGTRNDGVPALAYLAAQTPAEQPITVAFGGTLTAWKLQGSLVAAPALNVLVPIWTYGTVAALWATYQQAQTTLASKTYLDVLKSPSGV